MNTTTTTPPSTSAPAVEYCNDIRCPLTARLGSHVKTAGCP